MTGRRNIWWIGLAAMLALPAVAFANPNAGSAWMASGIWLLFGNAGLAVVEGMILICVLGVRVRYAFTLMLIANYVSSWLGLFGLWGVAEVVHSLGLLPIETELYVHYTTLTASLPLAILLEAPFYWLCLRLRRREGVTWRTSLRPAVEANIIANLITGAALALWLASASNTAMATRLDERADTAFVEDAEDLWMYFLDLYGDVQRVRLDGTERTSVFKPVHAPLSATLRVAKHGDAGLSVFYLHSDRASPVPLEAGFVAGTAWASGVPEWTRHEPIISTLAPLHGSRGEPLFLPPFEPSQPYGFDTTNAGAIGAESVTQITDTLYVAALMTEGHRRPRHIVVIDLDRRLLGHLARGSSPVVVREPPDEPPTLPVP